MDFLMRCKDYNMWPFELPKLMNESQLSPEKALQNGFSTCVRVCPLLIGPGFHHSAETGQDWALSYQESVWIQTVRYSESCAQRTGRWGGRQRFLPSELQKMDSCVSRGNKVLPWKWRCSEWWTVHFRLVPGLQWNPSPWPGPMSQRRCLGLVTPACPPWPFATGTSNTAKRSTHMTSA